MEDKRNKHEKFLLFLIFILNFINFPNKYKNFIILILSVYYIVEINHTTIIVIKITIDSQPPEILLTINLERK
jgi:hypothetical protein